MRRLPQIRYMSTEKAITAYRMKLEADISVEHDMECRQLATIINNNDGEYKFHSYNFDDQVAATVVSSLEYVTHLSLINCNMGYHSAVEMANMIKRNKDCIETLNISRNSSLCFASYKVLGEAIRDSNLKTLNLGSNFADKKVCLNGFSKNLLGNSSLKQLIIGKNRFSVKDYDTLVDTLLNIPTFKVLVMDQLWFSYNYSIKPDMDQITQKLYNKYIQVKNY